MTAPDLDRLLAPDYLEGIAELPIEDVRARREACKETEVGLSYVRRVVQGRLDIVLADIQRRQSGEGPSDLASLVEQLKRGEILGDKVRAPGVGRLPTYMAPADSDGTMSEELDRVIGKARLEALPDLSDAEVQQVADDLGALERTVSAQRRALHERIDAFQEEIVRRYRTGEASVDTLLR